MTENWGAAARGCGAAVGLVLVGIVLTLAIAFAVSGQWLAASILTGIVLLVALVGRAINGGGQSRGWERVVGWLLGGVATVVLWVTLFYLVLALQPARDAYEREAQGAALFGAVLFLVPAMLAGVLFLAMRFSLARRGEANNRVDGAERDDQAPDG